MESESSVDNKISKHQIYWHIHCAGTPVKILSVKVKNVKNKIFLSSLLDILYNLFIFVLVLINI